MNIFDIFEKASQTLQYPKIHFPYENEMLVFAQASQSARFPGAIYVNNKDRTMWYARVIKDAKARKLHIDWNPKVHVYDNMKQTIRALVADPVNICAVVGQQFAHCCFCGLELTNKDSVTVGYGPICADKWGLPHAGMADKKSMENL